MPAADGHDLLPRRPELRAHFVEHGAVVIPLMVEAVAADVDPLELLHDVARGALLGVAVAEELRRQLEHRAVERDVDDLGVLVTEAVEVEVYPLRRQWLVYGEYDQGQDALV